MDKPLEVTKRIAAALLALAALQISAVDAFAAKEKFVRNKPHVNVGTIGSTSSQTSGTSLTTTPASPGQPPADCEPDPAKAATSSLPPCAPVDAD